MSLNRAMVIGNLGGDPVLRNLPSGQPAVGFSIATDESFTDKEGQKQERVEWHQIVAFGKLAETCHQYLKKGRQVYVEGGSVRESSKQKTTAVNVSALRSSRPAFSFLVILRRTKVKLPPVRNRRSQLTKFRSKLP